MHGSSCNKLVKRNLIYDNKITYPDGNNIFEDFIVSVEMFYFARKISYIEEALYFYNKTNSGSLLTVKKVQSTCQAIENIERLCVFFEEKHIAAAYQKELAWTKLFAKAGLLEYGDKLKEWREIFKEANKHILSHPAFPAKVKAYQWCIAHRIWIAYHIKHIITKIRGKP